VTLSGRAFGAECPEKVTPPPSTSVLRAAEAAIDGADLVQRRGRVRDVIGLIIEASGLEAEVGEVCLIETGRDRPPVPAEVVGFRDSRTLLMPLGEMSGIGPGKPVSAEGEAFRVPVGKKLLSSGPAMTKEVLQYANGWAAQVFEEIKPTIAPELKKRGLVVPPPPK